MRRFLDLGQEDGACLDPTRTREHKNTGFAEEKYERVPESLICCFLPFLFLRIWRVQNTC